VTSIQMPQLGETIVEGTILKWLKQEGETIAVDEPLFEISTDKVDTEVPSPVAGTVTKILVAEGETVAVGTALAEISGDTADSGDASAAVASAGPAPSDSATSDAGVGASVSADATTAPAAPTPAAPVAAPVPTAAVSQPSGTIFSSGALPDRGPRSQVLSPLVRRLADEHGVDLTTVQGTGTGGRITKQDVLKAAGGGGGVGAPATAAAAAPPAAAVPAAAPTMAPAPVAAGAGEEVVPLTHIRKMIGTHMVASLQSSARAWTMVEVNVDHLVKLRERAKDAFFERHGVKLTYLPMVTRATAEALLEFPMVNAELRGDQLVLHRYVNMAIAVSYDEGLIVPVIRGVETMNVPGIARAIADLATRARAHQLKPDEVNGSTFTITNPGPYGSLISVPIINQPNAAILSLDTIQRRPVVIDDAIAIRSMVYLSMSWDHRVIDGELATRFLARIKQNLESWDFAEDLGL
jgi:2-oxoglutarate dehydrogenase E2 component (dihydrolipoamide succinyltransferase)